MRIICCSFLLWCALLLSSCSKTASSGATDKDEATPATPVQVAVVKRELIENIVTAEAVLYPLQQATIVPKVAAPVARFLVQRGDHVRKGQLLATLEDQDLVALAQESKQLYQQAQAGYQSTVGAILPQELLKAQSDLTVAQQSLQTAQKAYDSRASLLRQGAIAQRNVDDSRLALVQAQQQYETARQQLQTLTSGSEQQQRKQAEAQMNAAKAHYEGSEAQVSYAEIRSPIAGVVSERPLNVGEIAVTGTALLSVVDISRVTARAGVPAQLAAEMRVGQAATISGPGGELTGKVTVVSPTVDPNTTVIQVWVEAPNPGERLKLGTTAHISVDCGRVPDAIVVPPEALLNSDEGGEKVMVAGNDSLAHERTVQVGIRSTDTVQILSGLQENERVITQGALGLDDKAKIEIQKPSVGQAKGQADKDDEK